VRGLHRSDGDRLSNTQRLRGDGNCLDQRQGIPRGELFSNRDLRLAGLGKARRTLNVFGAQPPEET
jgi:hypothetical protein